MNQAVKGYFFAFGASFALAASFIFSKSALNNASMFLFGFTWFGVGAISNFIWLIFRRRNKAFSRRSPGVLSLALFISVLEGLATVLFYLAIQKMKNPAIVSFIGNIGPVLVTILGVTLLGEKYNRWQLTGILMALAGVFTITFNKETDISSLIQPGSQYVLMASVLFATATIVGRREKEKLEPELMSTIRSFQLFLVFGGIILVRDIPVELTKGTWSDIIIGSILETLITIVFAYQALRFLEAAKTSLVISTKAIWLVFMAWIIFDTFPMAYELTGGVLSLAGITIITLNRHQRSSRM